MSWAAVSRWWTLPTQFGVLFAIGSIVAIGFGFWTYGACAVRPVIPEPLRTEATVQPQDQLRARQYGFNDTRQLGAAIDRLSHAVKEIGTQQERDHRERHYSEPEPEISLCKFKIADFALIYLTFCLALIAYYTMRSSEVNTQHAERAFLFIGGGEQYPCQAFGNQMTNMMTCKNSGKSFGILTEYYFCWTQTEPTGPAQYPLAGGVTFAEKSDTVCNPGQTIVLNPSTVDFVTYPYCTGYVRYRDIYGILRESRCSVKMLNGKITPCSEDWNTWT